MVKLSPAALAGSRTPNQNSTSSHAMCAGIHHNHARIARPLITAYATSAASRNFKRNLSLAIWIAGCLEVIRINKNPKKLQTPNDSNQIRILKNSNSARESKPKFY